MDLFAAFLVLVSRLYASISCLGHVYFSVYLLLSRLGLLQVSIFSCSVTFPDLLGAALLFLTGTVSSDSDSLIL